MNKLAIQRARVLTDAGWIPDATVLIEDGRFVQVEQAAAPQGFTSVEATGLWMLPGIVDIHGDAFERMICPRPGVSFPLEMAIADNDRTLLAAGITTFYYSITDSYEPGLRSRDTARNMIALVLAGNETQALKCDSRIHIRHEQANTARHDELCQWIEDGKIQLLSLNDHLPTQMDGTTLQRYTKGLRQRAKLSDDEIRALIEQALTQQEPGFHQVEKLVEIAHQSDIPVASHDDETEEDVALSEKRQVAIAEFPGSIPLASKSQEYGASVLMGAPNLVRGGSHVGYMSVAEAAQHRVVDCLCSDYHYPSLFHAPFKMEQMGLMSLAEAWQLVSTNPAKAAGLGHQKGSIAPGLDADFLLVRPDGGLHSSIASVFVAGEAVARF